MDDLRCYFKKIHHHLESGFNKAYKKHGLTGTQLDVLMYLSLKAGGEATLSDIAAHFGVRHTSAIHVLKLLDKKGLVKKSAAGGRAKPILLTDGGKRLISEIKQKSPLLDEIMFAGFSEADMRLLEKMLVQICENLESDAFQNLSQTRKE